MNNKVLPPDFVSLMNEHFGSGNAQYLCDSLLNTEPEVSVRLNSRKINAVGTLRMLEQGSALACASPVEWCPDAYYLVERPPFTFDPLLHAGVYYVQEASSMYIAELCRRFLSMQAPCCALDLCAAPGGKSTLLAGLLPEDSFLLSNEPIAKRAQILAENMQKWTRMPDNEEYPVRSIVTNNYPADFRAFDECFDLVVTDVPCSGEGMFRKDEQAVAEWSQENVSRCVERQQGILSDIWHALKPGGLLIYSTCTFNRFEDEENSKWICSELGAELLEERHFLPGRDRGEGFYCAAIRKADDSGLLSAGRPNNPLPDFASEADKILRKAKTLLRIMPQAFRCEGPVVELTYDQALAYLRRETVRTTAPTGMLTLSYCGIPLGPGKGVPGRINNQYPDSWRIKTTYTKRWSLFDIKETDGI